MADFQTGIALHQIPRGKEVRSMIVAPPGHVIMEADASNQEVRLAAEMSGDVTMRNIFAADGDVHSLMGSRIAGISYEKFIEGKKQELPEIVGPTGYRYNGKVVVLSNLYRVGAKKMRLVMRVQYGLPKDIWTVKEYQALYHDTFPGIRQYWRNAIEIGKVQGYAETLAGRRYGIIGWDSGDGDIIWKCESAAINIPIQGSGADMTNLAMAVMRLRFPFARFYFALHDGIFYLVPIQYATDQFFRDVKETLSNLPYKEMWGWEPSIPFPYDVSYGERWSEKTKVK